jgi:hypothetical protein
MATHLVEILTFEGCPHGEPALELARRVIRETGAEAELRRVDVAGGEAAVTHRFLGSPTIRVDGRDVEPGADERHDYAISCRMYRTSAGLVGQPDAQWIREALDEPGARRGGQRA